MRSLHLSSLLQTLVCSIFMLAFCLGGAGCGVKPPPNLSPTGAREWQETRVIKALDLARDIAVEANTTMPPLLNQDTTRRVVLYHETALHAIHAAAAGWQAVAQSLTTDLSKTLTSAEQTTLRPYLSSIQAILKELTP